MKNLFTKFKQLTRWQQILVIFFIMFFIANVFDEPLLTETKEEPLITQEVAVEKVVTKEELNSQS